MRSPNPLNKSQFVIFGFLTFALAFFSLFALVPAQTPQRGSVDWIFIMDTSASMRGAGGSKNIFDKVKSTIGDFVRATSEGDSVTLYTFDRDTKARPTVRIADETDRRDLLKTIDEIQANGDRTYTGKAIHDALERAAELGQRPDAAQRTISIVLFTDGLEDVRGIQNPISIPSNIALIQREKPYLFFVSLGEEHERQLDELLKNYERGEVIPDPGADRISDIGKRIRKQIEAPAPPTPINLSVEPAVLDFGQVEPGDNTGRQAINVRSNIAVKARMTLEDSAGSGISMVEPQDAIEIKPGESTAVKIRLKAASSMANGARSVRLVLTPEGIQPGTNASPVSIEARLNVYHVPVLTKVLKWLAALLILLLIIIVALSFIKGETPMDMLKRWRERNNLEGEIEIIRPRPSQPEDETISLHLLKKDRVALSLLVPDGAGADADAELETMRKNGNKLIQLRRSQGIVRVNNVEVATTELYDGDIIDFGEARLRFNWLGHERPIDSDDI